MSSSPTNVFCLVVFGVLEQVRAALRDDTDLEMVSTEEQRDEAIALSTEQEDWLYDDGWDMDAATYRKKRAELAEVGGMPWFCVFELLVFVEVVNLVLTSFSSEYICFTFLLHRFIPERLKCIFKPCHRMVSAYLTPFCLVPNE